MEDLHLTAREWEVLVWLVAWAEVVEEEGHWALVD